VLLALGFLPPEINNALRASADNVFVAGDAASGASLVVKAIASGREAAKRIDEGV